MNKMTMSHFIHILVISYSFCILYFMHKSAYIYQETNVISAFVLLKQTEDHNQSMLNISFECCCLNVFLCVVEQKAKRPKGDYVFLLCLNKPLHTFT